MRNNISVDDKEEKSLKLSIEEAVCEHGWWSFESRITLKVETGAGVIKKYEQTQSYPNGYMTTWAMEMVLKNCIIDLLKDKETISYLES